MTKYIGNVPFVGKEKTVAFEAFCEKCGKTTQHYWVKPYNYTLKRTFFYRILCAEGAEIKELIEAFHTWQLWLKKKKAVEVAACEECGKVRVKCLHCGNVEDFTEWKEVYICPHCNKKSYMFANPPQSSPFWYFRWD